MEKEKEREERKIKEKKEEEERRKERAEDNETRKLAIRVLEQGYYRNFTEAEKKKENQRLFYTF